MPSDTLCDCSDTIPGVMGEHLPTNENTLSDFAIIPAAQGLRLQMSHLSINSCLIREADIRCQQYGKHTFGSSLLTVSNSRKYRLRASFHNSWKTVSDCETVLKERDSPVPSCNHTINRHNSKDIFRQATNTKVHKLYLEAE